MLGSLKSAISWKWAAFGKHPVAGDYFYAGSDDPFFQAFSGWVENGFRQISADRKNATDLFSWRFWARGAQKDQLVCGVGRDSFDTIGRPYPLVIIGTGPLPDWQRNWELLPFAFETGWEQMEYMITKRYLDFSQLEEEVGRLPAPSANWPAHESERRNRWEKWCTTEVPDPEKNRKTLRRHLKSSEFLVSFDGNTCRDLATSASFWCSLLKAEEKNIPNAAFLGGILARTYMAFFKRPLAVPDFIQLWSVDRNVSGVNENQPA